MSVKKLTLLSLFTTLSLAVYAAESALPPLAPVPGMKLGLANIVTLILLRHFSWKDAAAVLTARIALSALLFGQALSLLYSLAGGLLSLAVMAAPTLNNPVFTSPPETLPFFFTPVFRFFNKTLQK